MKKLILHIVFIISVLQAYPQTYDLIIHSNGDSIACHIDTVTDTLIFFEMKYNANWIDTQVNRDSVIDFKFDVIDKKKYKYISGTSKILTKGNEINSQYNIRKNSLILSTDYLFSITLSYERLIPINERTGFMLRAGTGYTGESGNELVIMGQPSLLYGRQKHFLETGVGYYQTFNAYPSFFPLIGYRYMGLKGFTIKIFVRADYYTDEEWVEEWGQGKIWPGFQIGYRIWL